MLAQQEEALLDHLENRFMINVAAFGAPCPNSALPGAVAGSSQDDKQTVISFNQVGAVRHPWTCSVPVGCSAAEHATGQPSYCALLCVACRSPAYGWC